MRLVILSSVARPAVQYFSILSHKRHDFRENVIEHKMFVLVLFSLSETFLILRRIRGYIVINVLKSSCKVPVILLRF